VAADSTNTLSVHTALSWLAERRGNRPRPALIGFEASRHLGRADFSAIDPLVVDMPISEETMAGMAIGVAVGGRDVVVDLMFEGFLSRCVEPLLVGWPTALALSARPTGRIVLRVLGGPIAHGGPSHSAPVLELLAGTESIVVAHPTSPEEVVAALVATPPRQLLVLADPTARVRSER
jgi:hypothetical protein